MILLHRRQTFPSHDHAAWRQGKKLTVSTNLQVIGIQHGSFEVLDPGVLSFEEPLELEIRVIFVEEKDFNVHIISGRMQV